MRLSDRFDLLLEASNSPNHSPKTLSEWFSSLRDQFRDQLSSHDPTKFPRRGPFLAPICAILELLFGSAWAGHRTTPFLHQLQNNITGLPPLSPSRISIFPYKLPPRNRPMICPSRHLVCPFCRIARRSLKPISVQGVPWDNAGPIIFNDKFSVDVVRNRLRQHHVPITYCANRTIRSTPRL